MNDLKSKFLKNVETQLARVLTQMDRDPDSPTFGCFDRKYWHYKTGDFPSSILQQGIFSLEAIRKGSVDSDVDQKTIEKWCIGAVNALMNQVDSNGAVNEYFPYENSYPAAAFSLYAVCKVLFDWKNSAPHLLELINWPPLERLTAHLAGRVERKASNQQAAGLAGLAYARQIGISSISESDIKNHVNHLLNLQHDEGWFEEYGGADFGYLSVTLDALSDYYEVARDENVMQSIEKAVHFMAICVGADGKLPSTLNSRNTDYIVPYGLVRTANTNQEAAWLVKTIFQDLDDPNHFLWAVDDRYHVHYIFSSLIRSLDYLDEIGESEKPDRKKNLWMNGCGYWIYWGDNFEWNVFVGTKKGGVMRIHKKDHKPVTDNGWRIQHGNKLWTTNWWFKKNKIDRSENRIKIKQVCKIVEYQIPTPMKHFYLRVLAWILRERLTPFLKRILIFRPGETKSPSFSRDIEINEKGVKLKDIFSFKEDIVIKPAPRQNVRHVASADSFNFEEWGEGLFANKSIEIKKDEKVEIAASWKYII